jgi:tetratricopeptide (TPR) repeat protein
MRAAVAVVWRAHIYARAGRFVELVTLAEEWGGEEGKLAPWLAVAVAGLGDVEGGRAIARRGIARRRTRAELAMGELEANAGNPETALLWYERAMQRFDRVPAFRRAGKVLMQLGDDEEAAAAWERAIRCSHDLRVGDVRQLAECWRRLGREGEAAELEALAGDAL